MTTRAEALAAKLILPGGALPRTITDLKIEVAHTPVAIDRGVPARLKEDIADILKAIGPLFAAGFSGMGASSTFKLKLGGDAQGVRITISGANHTPMLVTLMLRLIEVFSQTPAGAYEYLLDMLDGDEEEAKAAFNPLSFVADVASVTVTAPGEPRDPYTVAAPSLRPDLAPLVAAINVEDDRQIFNVPRNAQYDDALDHGFMTLLGHGVFRPLRDDSSMVEEPEIFIQPADRAAQVVVDGWNDDPLYLAELLRVIAGGQAGNVQPATGE
jgi:hypothetical protein